MSAALWNVVWRVGWLVGWLAGTQGSHPASIRIVVSYEGDGSSFQRGGRRQWSLEGIASCAVTGALRWPIAATDAINAAASTLAKAFATAPPCRLAMGAAGAYTAQRRGGERNGVRSERIRGGRQRSRGAAQTCQAARLRPAPARGQQNPFRRPLQGHFRSCRHSPAVRPHPGLPRALRPRADLWRKPRWPV